MSATKSAHTAAYAKSKAEPPGRVQTLIPIIVADIYELAGRLRDHGERIARTVNQTQARWQVLSAASGHPQTVPQIARMLGVTRQNVQRIADLLVAEGAAEYHDNPDHRGSPHLLLTKRGRAAFVEITKAADGYHGRLVRKLSPSEVASLQRGLRRLLDALADVDPVVKPNRKEMSHE
jgi:DNA-binding MarR family transcriptional regulator